MIRRLTLTLVLLALLPTLARSQISGTATVQPADPQGPFADYWCYTVDLTWSTTKSLSHLTVYVGLENLVCACEPGLFVFPSPAGSTSGEEDGETCDLAYDGEYVCTGDPSLPPGMDDLAAVKFDPITEPCDAGSTGSGTFVYYSLLAPAPPTTYEDVLVIKNGQNADTGDIVGSLPAADCAVHNGDSSWGQLKSIFN